MTGGDTRERLGFGPKLGYGVGNLGVQCFTSASVAFLLYYYTDVLALAPLYVGIGLTLPRFWDAISDPLMGVLSDRTHSPRGRRRPYILWGAPFLCLSFVLLWFPPSGHGQLVLFAYLIGANLLFTTMITVVGVPYTSLGGELCHDYHERTAVFAFSQAFGMLGGLAGMAMLTLAGLVAAGDMEKGFPIVALGFSVPSLALLIWSYTATQEVGAGERIQSAISLRQVIATNFRNRAFRNLALSMVVVNSGMILGVQFLPFMLKYWIQREGFLFPAYAAYTFAVYLGFPLWKRIGERKDKKHVLAGGFLAAGAVYGLSFFMFQPGAVVLLLMWAVLVGLCGAAGLLYPFSMIADIADEDELATGQRSAGIFYGAYSFIQKCSVAAGSMVSALALGFAGYEADAPAQTAGTLLVFRLVYVAPAATFLVAAVLVYRGYPLTRERVAEIKRQLTSHEDGESQPLG